MKNYGVALRFLGPGVLTGYALGFQTQEDGDKVRLQLVDSHGEDPTPHLPGDLRLSSSDGKFHPFTRIYLP